MLSHENRKQIKNKKHVYIHNFLKNFNPKIFLKQNRPQCFRLCVYVAVNSFFFFTESFI